MAISFPRTWTCQTHMRAMWCVLGSYTILWGLWLLSPWWSVFTRAPLYSEMHKFVPEWAWGVNAILAGSIMVFGATRSSWRVLAWGMGSGVYHWGTISALYFVGDWKNTGGVTSGALAVLIVVTWWVSVYCDKLHRALESRQINEREIIGD